MKRFLTILLTLLGSAVYAQQQSAYLGIGTNGIGLNYERNFLPQFSAGGSINYFTIKGATVNYLLDNFVKTDYKTNSLQLEGFVKWYPQFNQEKISNRLYAKVGLAIRLNPSYEANSTFMDKTMIGSFELNPNQVGYVNIDVRTNRVQPMLAGGYRIVDKQKFFVNSELGVYVHGSPQVRMEATGTLHLNTVNQESIQAKINKYKYFPLLNIQAGIKL